MNLDKLPQFVSRVEIITTGISNTFLYNIVIDLRLDYTQDDKDIIRDYHKYFRTLLSGWQSIALPNIEGIPEYPSWYVAEVGIRHPDWTQYSSVMGTSYVTVVNEQYPLIDQLLITVLPNTNQYLSVDG